MYNSMYFRKILRKIVQVGLFQHRADCAHRITAFTPVFENLMTPLYCTAIQILSNQMPWSDICFALLLISYICKIHMWVHLYFFLFDFPFIYISI